MLELTRFLPYLLIIAFPVLQTGKAVAADREALGEECYELLHPSDSEHSRVEKQQGKECLTRFYKLSTLIVTPLRRPESLQQSAASVSVVTSRDIERSAADGVAEVLRDIPGIDVTDSGQAGLKRIRLRGEEARRVRIMIDGQEFSDQREVGTPILIAPELIERIEVVRGTGSVLHVSRAIGGVINIITKKEGYHPLQATIGSSFDTATEGHQTVASAYGTVKGIGYRFAGTFAEHGDRDTPAGELENTSFRNKSWNGYLAKEWGEHRLA
ncbi:MAG: TonB-dependent receptor plug domain-containing protein, partial [Gammaproteobacteria bacterium]